ncbi:histone-lysine N-methyltransferase SMYD3-like [Octopus sinensis]|uniref:Histone-lysine N-methyltransferase SMYD3-like n=1 Tax=Octopus sinensis TaxID=2607531 RepID=A0A7E6FG66_9MOLL|nr:histone-lysine N-methyltransferase SMYD3-like [Octopus sinensis]
MDLDVHRTECLCYQNQGDPVLPPSDIRMVLRLVIRWQNKDYCKEFVEDPMWKRQFLELMSHYQELKQSGVKFNLTYFHDVVGKTLELPSDETIFEMYGKMLINCFAIPDEDYTLSIGTGIYLSSSKIDHSCVPNAVMTYNGTEQFLKALEYIPEPEPNKIFISYINTDRPSWIRKDFLRNNYYFDCSCANCKETECLDRKQTSVHCPNVQCSGFIGISSNDGKEFFMLPCSVCGLREDSSEILEETKTLWSFGIEKIQELRELDKCKDYENELQLAEETLTILKETRIHETNLIYVEVMELAKEACIELRLWSKAAYYGNKVWPQRMQYFEHSDFRVGLLLYELGKLYLNAMEIENAREIFRKASTILGTYHDKNDFIFKQQQILQQYCDTFDSNLQLSLENAAPTPCTPDHKSLKSH